MNIYFKDEDGINYSSLSGDKNPIHLDEEYSYNSIFGTIFNEFWIIFATLGFWGCVYLEGSTQNIMTSTLELHLNPPTLQ